MEAKDLSLSAFMVKTGLNNIGYLTNISLFYLGKNLKAFLLKSPNRS